MNIFIKTKSYLKRYGALNLIRKVTEKASRGFDISEEFACENLTDEELLKQRNYKFYTALSLALSCRCIIRMTGISGRHLIQLKTSHTKTGSYV